jgi:hypothetical protein
LRVFAGAGATVALQEGAEANQGDAVLAVQGAGDFFENGVKDAVCLFFGEIRFFSDGGCEFCLRMSEASLTVFCCYVRAALLRSSAQGAAGSTLRQTGVRMACPQALRQSRGDLSGGKNVLIPTERPVFTPAAAEVLC